MNVARAVNHRLDGVNRHNKYSTRVRVFHRIGVIDSALHIVDWNGGAHRGKSDIAASRSRSASTSTSGTGDSSIDSGLVEAAECEASRTGARSDRRLADY